MKFNNKKNHNNILIHQLYQLTNYMQYYIIYSNHEQLNDKKFLDFIHITFQDV